MRYLFMYNYIYIYLWDISWKLDGINDTPPVEQKQRGDAWEISLNGGLYLGK